ncbi:hypothetical protein [Butyrivibrio sp. AE3003]|uniref:hypothetical protein n=1 Tax=Butyrivibrio sp. AE3003 TaxID=1496721 RepID=UPI00047EFC8A|nr:hypothetical protein [Butyrivibrio sp. AE3003]
MFELLVVGEFLFDLSILAMEIAAHANISDYRVTMIFIVLVVGIGISFIPSLLREAGIIKSTVKYIDFEMILKFIMWAQTLYFAYNFFLLTVIINVICLSFSILCKVKICNEVRSLNINVLDAINGMKKIDSSYMEPHYPFIIGDFFTIAFLLSFHETIAELIISGSICVTFFGIGIFRLWKKEFLSKKDILCLILVEVLMITLGAMNMRLITCILYAEFCSRFRDALKRMAN